MTLGPEERFRLALGKAALEQLRTEGHGLMVDDQIVEIGREAGLPDHLIDHEGDKLEREALVWNTSPSVYLTTPIATWYEEHQEPVAWRERNRLRREVLQDLRASFERNESYRSYKEDNHPFGETPFLDLRVAVATLDARCYGYVELHHESRGLIMATLMPSGYDLVRDDGALTREFPISATEDRDAHAPVVPDVLSALITSCEQLLIERGWTTALDELRRGDRDYADGEWVDAVRDYYEATESGLKYRLAEAGVEYPPTAALKDLARLVTHHGLVPRNYQQMFAFLDSIRSPRRHGQGPETETVEVGQAEALLMGNHARSLLVYLGHRPADV